MLHPAHAYNSANGNLLCWFAGAAGLDDWE
jgi:hypothetical protein